jgi:hypothetical protein
VTGQLERLYLSSGYHGPRKELAQLVEHGDLLSECKQAQEGLFGRSERERGIPNTLLITRSGVRVSVIAVLNRFRWLDSIRWISWKYQDSRRIIGSTQSVWNMSSSLLDLSAIASRMGGDSSTRRYRL